VEESAEVGGGEHRTRPGVEARAPVADRSGCRCRAGCGAKVDEEGCDLSEEVAAASELAHDVRIGDAARARCIALFTDAGVVSRMSATSAALNPSTSRRISTARWEPGRCYSAAMKASSTLPVAGTPTPDPARHRQHIIGRSVTQPASAMGPSCDR